MPPGYQQLSEAGNLTPTCLHPQTGMGWEGAVCASASRVALASSSGSVEFLQLQKLFLGDSLKYGGHGTQPMRDPNYQRLESH